MPRFTVNGHEPRFGDEILHVAPVPCAVFDATGKRIETCFFWDTDSGLVGRYHVDSQGKWATNGIRLAQFWEQHPAPLTVKSLRP